MTKHLSLVFILVVTSSLPAAEPAPEKAVIAFLDKDAAGKAILSEKIEPYFELLTPMEMAVKSGSPLPEGTLAQQREAFCKRYQEGMLDFTDAEKKLLTECIQRVHPILQKHYPLAAKQPWSLIKKSDRLEGGAHFTRENHIVLSQNFLTGAVRASEQVDIDKLVPRVMMLLLHEQTHVLQRLHPKLFAKMYVDLWNLEHAKSIEETDWLKGRQLVNPDAIDVNWIARVKDEDTGKTVVFSPRILLTKTTWPIIMFRDAEMVVLELEQVGDEAAGAFRVKTNDDGEAVRTPLRQSRAFVARFPHGNAYHPNEAAAALWPIIVLGDKYGEEKNAPEAVRAYEAKARQWLREAMANE